MERIEINSRKHSYPLFIGDGAIAEIGDLVKGYNGVYIVTDSNVYSLYKELLDKHLSIDKNYIVVKPGEESKGITIYLEVINSLIAKGITRKSLIIAFGGGVIGDLAGFVASTLYRGVDFVGIPTTLLAQVDSSIGGKVGINIPKGKNLIGSFYPPVAVILDSFFLSTLSRECIEDGLVEAFKAYLIGDPELGTLFDGPQYDYDAIIKGAIMVKRRIVEEDEREGGSRILLNLGHTLAHAIEAQRGFGSISHGRAVAMGIIIEGLWSEGLGLSPRGTFDRIRGYINRICPGLRMDGVYIGELKPYILSDKKVKGSSIDIPYVKSFGQGGIYSLPMDRVDELLIRDLVKISPRPLGGSISMPPSKSYSHRAIICASLAKGESIIKNIILSRDIKATIKACEDLGARIEVLNKISGRVDLKIIGRYKEIKSYELNADESGSTLRFMIPILLALGIDSTFWGMGRLRERPIDEYLNIMKEEGISYSYEGGKLPLNVTGKLKASTFKIKGNVSSQYITGLLLALPLLKGDSEIIIEGNLESKSYVDMSISVIKEFGIEIIEGEQGFSIKGGQSYRSREYYVEGDYSQAAFFVVGGAIGEGIQICGLNPLSLQGDRAIIDIARAMGARIEGLLDGFRVYPSKTLGIEIDGSQIPDIVPILAVLGAFSEGVTRLYNIKRLRYKESDRIGAISSELSKLGAEVIEGEDYIEVRKGYLRGNILSSHRDHRIAMAMAIAASRVSGEVLITDFASISKSYPGFLEDYKALGGEIDGDALWPQI